MKRVISIFSLFTSASTLVCCALPALFVTLGAGATFAGLLSNFPQLIWLSEKKVWVFGLAGLMLILTAILRKNAENQACPVDPELAKSCDSARKTSKVVFWISVGIYLTGAFFAFAAPIFF